MRKSLFIFAILMTLQCKSQTLKMPKFTKIVEVVSKGVNLRKEASTSSPRLVGWFVGDRDLLEKGGIVDDPSKHRMCFGWENEAGTKGKPANAKYLLVVSETDEWYYACPLINNLELPEASSKLVFVSKKVCKVKQPMQLSSSYFEHYYEFTGGKYKGFCCFCDYVESSFLETLFLGRIENGIGFGWSRQTSGEEDYNQLKKNPDEDEYMKFRREHNRKDIDIIIGERVPLYDNHGEEFDTINGIVTYQFYPNEYEGELISY